MWRGRAAKSTHLVWSRSPVGWRHVPVTRMVGANSGLVEDPSAGTGRDPTLRPKPIDEHQPVGPLGVTVDLQAATVVQAMVTVAQRHQVRRCGHPAVLPVADVVDLHPGRRAPRHPTPPIPLLDQLPQPDRHDPGGPARGSPAGRGGPRPPHHDRRTAADAATDPATPGRHAGGQVTNRPGRGRWPGTHPDERAA